MEEVIIIKLWVKMFVFALVIAAVSVYLANTTFIQILLSGDVEAFLASVSDQFLPLLFITLLLMIVQNVITFIPLILILTINVFSYGFLYGLLWSWASSIVAASSVFLLVRYVFKQNLINKVSSTIKEKAERNGFMYVLLARIFPFFPTSIVNVVCGVTSIKFKDFLFATAVGNFLYFFVLSSVPFGILKADPTVLLIGLIVAIIGFLLFRKYRKKSEPKINSVTD